MYAFLFFFFNDTATTEIYTLSLHDALPISHDGEMEVFVKHGQLNLARALLKREERINQEYRDVLKPDGYLQRRLQNKDEDRKSTRLNSSHGYISYAVFCLKKKKQGAHIRRS